MPGPAARPRATRNWHQAYRTCVSSTITIFPRLPERFAVAALPGAPPAPLEYRPDRPDMATESSPRPRLAGPRRDATAPLLFKAQSGEATKPSATCAATARSKTTSGTTFPSIVTVIPWARSIARGQAPSELSPPLESPLGDAALIIPRL